MVKKKHRPKALLPYTIGILVLIVIGIGIIAIAITRENTGSGEGIPLYIGSSFYRRLDASNLKKSLSLLQINPDLNDTCIVMFGLTTCSHCHNMYEFFRKNYSEIYRVFWIDTDNVAGEVFTKLANIELKSGIPPGFAFAVPQTLAIVGGEVKAIVIGYVNMTDFWDSILKKAEESGPYREAG